MNWITVAILMPLLVFVIAVAVTAFYYRNKIQWGRKMTAYPNLEASFIDAELAWLEGLERKATL
jgi:uncharacterized membrane protein YoaK (UPF0700 family)